MYTILIYLVQIRTNVESFIVKTLALYVIYVLLSVEFLNVYYTYLSCIN